MRFVDYVGEEILGTKVATIHPLFYDKQRAELVGYEGRLASKAYISPEKGTRYYAGGFFGGTKNEFLSMAAELAGCIDEDLKNGVIAKWHDESHLNRYFADHPPAIELTPSYCYPEGMSLPFKPKLLALIKDHAMIRAEETIFSRLYNLLKWNTKSRH
jgi:histo-blood group ABO system transferase